MLVGGIFSILNVLVWGLKHILIVLVGGSFVKKVPLAKLSLKPPQVDADSHDVGGSTLTNDIRNQPVCNVNALVLEFVSLITLSRPRRSTK